MRRLELILDRPEPRSIPMRTDQAVDPETPSTSRQKRRLVEHSQSLVLGARACHGGFQHLGVSDDSAAVHLRATHDEEE